MIGNDCPECSKRLRADGACSCGWKPYTNDDVSGRKGCDHCGITNTSLNVFHDDTLVVADRRARLCASCWIPALRRRADADRSANTGKDGVYRCSEPGCTLSVAEHIAAAKSIASSSAWELKFGTSRE